MEKSYSLYGSFSTEEAGDIGKTFEATCKANYGYEGQLTEGKTYTIKIEPRIMPLTPLCSFMNDRGKIGCCHLTRFEKATEENNKATKGEERGEAVK